MSWLAALLLLRAAADVAPVQLCQGSQAQALCGGALVLRVAVHVRRMTFEKEGVREAAMRAAQASSDLAATAQKIAIGQTYIPSHMDREHRRLTSRAVAAKVRPRNHGCSGVALMSQRLSPDCSSWLSEGHCTHACPCGLQQDSAWRRASLLRLAPQVPAGRCLLR